MCMLIAITGAARTQSIHQLGVHSVKKLSSEFVFQYDGLIKQVVLVLRKHFYI